MTDHPVEAGECLHAIAVRYGFFWETLWNLPENAELKKLRKGPESLEPGDVVHIPDLREKVSKCPTNNSYRFRKKTKDCLGLQTNLETLELPHLETDIETEELPHFEFEIIIPE